VAESEQQIQKAADRGRRVGDVSYSVRDGVAMIIVDRPPVNAAGPAVRQGVLDFVKRAKSDPAAKAILLACAGRTFISGADLNELTDGVGQPNFNAVLVEMEASEKPVVVSIHGTALGGGLETAMAGHYRIAVPSAKMGLPEITLGIIPGAGGTQRAPRLLGAAKALDMMLKGAPLSAKEALEAGLVDKVADGDPIEVGLAYAKELIAQGAKPRRTSERKADATGFSEADIAAALKANEKALKNRTTQHDLVKAIKAAVELPFAEGVKLEEKLSAHSLTTTEAKALIHVFFAEREAGKIPGLPPTIEPLQIKKAAVIGAGTMGGGIAMSLADSGLPVVLIEAKQEFLDRGMKTIRGNYDVSVKRGRMTEGDVEARMALITPTLDQSLASDVDVVIEAVFENMDLKKSVLAGIDKVLPKHAVLASNTSSLSLTELASATNRPDKVIGLHFFSPANVMRLLEIVRGEKTSLETLATAQAIAKKLRKIGVVAGDGFGFIGNRMMLDGQWRENEVMLLEGVPPERLDAAIEGFGFAMGPNKVNDMGGVDIGTKVRIELLKREKREAPYHVVSDSLTPTGNLGQKTGQGVYRYEKGDRTPRPNPDFAPFVKKLAEQYGVKQREVSDAEIVERMVLPLINIGAQILDEGVAYRAGDIDVVWTSGYGFPRYRGGPMFYADTLGLPKVLERIKHYAGVYGPTYWKPAPLIEKLVKDGKSFADYDKAIAG
jgi:3-hydroxyacyl-CoA dehydrogenase